MAWCDTRGGFDAGFLVFVQMFRAWVSSNFLNSPRGAVSLVTSFAQRVSSMSTADKMPRTLITVPIGNISEFADLNTVADLLREVNNDELTDKERIAKSRFLSGKAMKDSGEDPDQRFPFAEES